MSKIIPSILVVAGGLFLSGCCSPNSHGNVYRQWSSRMAEMGIFPVYPPREDIVVGDVYALPLHPYDTAAVGYIGGLGNAGIHVEYLGDKNLGWADFLTKLENYYQTRPYPADSTNGLVAGTNVPLTEISGYPDAAPRTSAFSRGSVARLRQVSFPDFNISQVDQASLSAVIPIEGIMAGFNFNRSDITGVHFSIPHAESYGLTTEELLQELLMETNFVQTADGIYFSGAPNTTGTNGGVISVAGAQMARAMFQDIVQKVVENPDNCIPWRIKSHMRKSIADMKDCIYLALISEVYFARSMDITIDRKTATGASGSARPIAAAELKQLKDMGLLALAHTKTNWTTTTNTAAGTNVVVGTQAELIDVTEGDSAFDLARKLRGLETPDGVDKIGGSVKVVSVSASSIGLRRTFQRPICVGVRGVLVKLDVNHPVALGADGNVDPNGRDKYWMKVQGIGQ